MLLDVKRLALLPWNCRFPPHRPSFHWALQFFGRTRGIEATLKVAKRTDMSLTDRSLVAVLVVPLCLAGCSDRKAEPGSTIGASATDKWLGQWNGPEGTFLRLTGGTGKYEITIQNLDGPRKFQGSAVDDQIQFERNGVKESIRATNRAGTGMKWLSDKSNCLTVRAGEGYCRD